MRLLLVISLALALTTTARADRLAECNKTLSLCKQAVDDQAAALKAKEGTIVILTQQRDEAIKRLEAEQSKVSPLVYFVIGAGAAVAAAVLLKR